MACVASTREYTLDASVSEVLAVVLTGGSLSSPKEVSFAPRERLIARGKDLSTSTTGTPDYWYYTGVDSSGNLKIAFQPVPDDTYTATLQVLDQPSTPGDSDEIALPREFERVLKEGIRFRAYRNEGQIDLATLSYQIFQSGLQLLNARFLGPFAGGSGLKVKTRMKQIDQAPAAADGT